MRETNRKFFKKWLGIATVAYFIASCAANEYEVIVHAAPELDTQSIILGLCDRRVSATSIEHSTLTFETKIDCEGVSELIYEKKVFEIGYVTTGFELNKLELSFDGNSIVILDFQIQ